MSVYFTVEIKDAATQALRLRMARCSPERINTSVGHSALLLTQKHLLALPHNKKGWRPLNFWGEAAAATTADILPDGAIIRISKIGVRQRLQGGVILPVNAKALAIPIDEQAYGKTPGDFGDQLQLVVVKDVGAFLALKPPQTQNGKKGRRKKGDAPAETTTKERLAFLFRLSAGVEQAANPDVLPTREEYASDAIQAIKDAIE